MLCLLVFSSLFLSASALTQCREDSQQGPPFMGSCPPGTVPTDDGGPSGVICCDPAGVTVIDTTLAPGATTQFVGVNTGTTVFGQTTAFGGRGTGTGTGVTAAGSCVDLLNPRTGVSDCPQRRAYCTDPVYITVMRQQCPRTCGFCSNSTTTTIAGCVDLLNPRTGVSDCPQRRTYCTDPVYLTVMRQQCPRTCGFCNGSTVTGLTGLTSTARSVTGACVDQVNPATGRSDCQSLRSMCTNSLYRQLMRVQCPVTCGFCSG